MKWLLLSTPASPYLSNKPSSTLSFAVWKRDWMSFVIWKKRLKYLKGNDFLFVEGGQKILWDIYINNTAILLPQFIIQTSLLTSSNNLLITTKKSSIVLTVVIGLYCSWSQTLECTPCYLGVYTTIMKDYRYRKTLKYICGWPNTQKHFSETSVVCGNSQRMKQNVFGIGSRCN